MPVVSALPPPIRLRRFTLGEYLAMGEAGILLPEDRVELIDGTVVQMSPVGTWHTASVTKLAHLAHDQVRRPLTVSTQNALNIGEYTQVTPDLAVYRPVDDPWERGNQGDDCLLAIEVALTSLASDRTTKKALYGAAGIPEYWIVDLERRAIEVYRDLKDAVYGEQKVFSVRERVESVSVPDLAIPVADVVPPPDKSMTTR